VRTGPWEPPLAGTEVGHLVKLSGEPIGAPWDATDWDGDYDWEFTSAANDTPEQLYAMVASILVGSVAACA
jgi:hypothetical protein